MASDPARTRLFWAILSLVLPVTFGHTIACRSLALAFSAAIYFAMKRVALYSAVLRHFSSSWAAVVHWSALIPKALRSSKKHPIHSFPWPPTQPAPPTTSPNITHLQSRCHKSRKQDPPPSYSRLDALNSRLDKRVQHVNSRLCELRIDYLIEDG